MSTGRTYTRTDKYYDWHRTDEGKGKKGDKGKDKQSEAKDENQPTARGKYCYAKVTANVSRYDSYPMFYQACGALIAEGKWDIVYREQLGSFDETLEENKCIMGVLVNSTGLPPTEADILTSFWEMLRMAHEDLMKMNNRKWDALEKLFDAAVKRGFPAVQRALLEEFDNLYKIDSPTSSDLL
ncbi:hypothetical protein ABOM_006046 [Aspergillus bombycis]|uniref:Uncharacterized protein n=1 Tax=Aspergillus bombycis TaxID=109264 RepID=A0A1F8A3I8_9EURO|nr:hypothetical protein ABOM_006046 [Aspergillus bombycis]OGM45878.1 hypothetical protein ABOM_006046 [Aspergillus bombycis]